MMFFTITGIIVWSLIALLVAGCVLSILGWAFACWYRFYRLRVVMLRRDADYAKEHPPFSIPLKQWVIVIWRFMTGRYSNAEHDGIVVPANPFARIRRSAWQDW